MKHATALIPSVFIAMTTTTQGDTLTIPHSFTTGTPAVAAEVNANFSASKAAVDDNDARITSNSNGISTNTSAISNLDTGKQNRVNGVCSSGYAIRSINTDGSVVCELDNDSGGDIQGVTAGTGLQGGGSSGTVEIKLNWGAVSVHASAFTPTSPNCDIYRNIAFSYFTTTSTSSSCRAQAAIQLPHRATVTSLYCYLYDYDASGYGIVGLYRIANGSGNYSLVFSTPATIDSTSVQTQRDYTAEVDNVVDNINYSYMLYWALPSLDTTLVNTNARLYGCMLYYVYQ